MIANDLKQSIGLVEFVIVSTCQTSCSKLEEIIVGLMSKLWWSKLYVMIISA